MGQWPRQETPGAQGLVTSDLEREAVLRQNELLRDPRFKDCFQALRRCCVCLRGSCEDKASCSAEFEAWTKSKWAAELGKEHVRRHPGVGTPLFGDGH